MPAPDIEMYYRNLGRFVTRFAEVEASLRTLCSLATGMTPDLAGIVFGDLTVRNASTVFIRMRQKLGLPDDPEINRALSHLRVIATVRNAILHRGVRLSDDDDLQTGPGLYGMERAAINVGADVLEQMHADLAIILAALALWKPRRYDGYDEWASQVRTVVQTPWQYTPPQ